MRRLNPRTQPQNSRHQVVGPSRNVIKTVGVVNLAIPVRMAATNV